MGTHHASGSCHRCGRGGHLARECSLHVCFRCNGKGHMAWECVEGVTCSRCGERGHLQRNCKNVSCHKCGRKGHISKFCNDPFIKAEEAERHERQQALFKARTASGHGIGKGRCTSQVRPVATATRSLQIAPGPWDGLGDRGQETVVPENCTSRGRVIIGKRSTNTSEGGFLEKVKIVSVKRKTYLEANIERDKRGSCESGGDQGTDMGADLYSTKISKNDRKDEKPVLWNGLVCYDSGDGSGDLRDDGCMSSDAGSEERNCPFGNVHLEFKMFEGRGAQDGDSYAVPFQGSLEQEVLCEDTRVSEKIVADGSLHQGNTTEELQ